ncbi:MAG TPA: 50S ribosomal protein L1 [Phycisphaerae bacterium]|nr:50S ribosomal protein L1 [Phycisphaerae bacterium]HPS52019.1 50S ribosomal protein L1 [Phycisphaerae bacterium]
MAKVCHGKRYRQCLEKVPSAPVSVADAVKALKTFAVPKFDMTVDLVMHLGIDPKQADQQLRGSISLPHGIGKSKKVIAFCEGSELEAAKKAGAVEVGGDDLIKKITDGWMDFDVAIATPAMMKSVSKLGRVLGPSGKMPSPKAGTVAQDVAKAVAEFAAGKIEYRNDDFGNVHVPVGKMSFDEKVLVENIEFFIDYVKRHKPSTSKGTYIKKISVSGTMTPGIAIAAN